MNFQILPTAPFKQVMLIWGFCFQLFARCCYHWVVQTM